MKLCRSEWGLTFLSIPACLARRRTTRAAWCRFMRSPVPMVKIGPSVRSPTARYTVRAVRCKRDDDGSASFAVHPQRVMATFESEVVDVSVERLGDAEAIERQQTRQGVITGPGQASLDEERAEFVAIQSTHRRFASQSGSPHIRCRIVGEEFFFYAVPVEPRDGRQPTTNRGTRRAAMLEPAGKQLDVRPSHIKQTKLLVGAPRGELTEILPIRQPGIPRVARQEPSQSQLNLEHLLPTPPRQSDR